jgi:hypothetical protein
MKSYDEAMSALKEAAHAALRAAGSEDGAPVDALRELAAEVDSLIDHGATCAEVRSMHALYFGARAAGLV